MISSTTRSWGGWPMASAMAGVGWGASRSRARRPTLHIPRLDQGVDLVPALRARLADVAVGAVGKTDGVEPLRAQAPDVVGRVFDIDVGADLLLVLHEAEVVIGNAL